jgi:hypothetical protein
MKRGICDRPTILPASEEWSGNRQTDSAGPQGNTVEAATGVDLQPAQQAIDEQEAPSALPPMVFPGPLAYQPVPLIPPGASAPEPLPIPAGPGSPVVASNSASQPASSGSDPDGADLQVARISHLAAALMQADFDRVLELISELGMSTVAGQAPVPGDPPLVYAAHLGHLGRINALLDAGVEVNLAHSKTGSTALMAAAIGGHVEIVQRLLNKPGIERDKLAANGDSALTIPLRNKQPGVVDCLLDAGVRVDLPETLHQAVSEINASLVEVLFKHGAQLSDITHPLTHHPDRFVVTVEEAMVWARHKQDS